MTAARCPRCHRPRRTPGGLFCAACRRALDAATRRHVAHLEAAARDGRAATTIR